MPLSWNEIRNRSYSFVKEWEEETSEHAEAKSFWDDFFHVFGISRRRVASFESHVKKTDGKDGFIDLLWKGMLLIEHKSRGKDLERAHQQAKNYFQGLKDEELPKYILVSDFEKFRLYDLDQGGTITAEFSITEFPKNIKHFGFIAGYRTTEIKPEDPVNIAAAEKMGKLHDQLKEIGYTGKSLEIYLVRLLFCLFAEDTGIFERNLFYEFIRLHTKEDGSDLAGELAQIFHVLNTPQDNRLKNLPEHLSAFEYVNGQLFSDFLPLAGFDSKMRKMLLEACVLDWGKISPAIFGSLFQSVMEAEARRNLGAHYTSESNILKVIKSLFLDDLWEEFERIKGNRKKLEKFHEKLATLTFFDPACGCGNFLVISYRELRMLELEILKILYPDGILTFDISFLVRVDVDQFYGIEIEEFPAQIAQVAMWLMDHQMNLIVSEAFGHYFARLPLKKSATIIHGNALRLDWEDFIPKSNLSYILGNPPFIGKTYQTKEQKADVLHLSEEIKNASELDYVAAWYIKATNMMINSKIRCAFVSTNSITQGEQVIILWNWLLSKNVDIFFAHRTFQWQNEARGKAAVHCVIIGFSTFKISPKFIFEYESIRGKPHMIPSKNINPYLVDAENLLIKKRRSPLNNSLPVRYGNKPTDDGNYIFTLEEKKDFIKKEPYSEKFFRRYIGAKEFINSIPRFCLWLRDSSPKELKESPEVLKRFEAVRNFRRNSSAKPTQKSAETPQNFFYISHTESNSLVIPENSSGRRNFIPVGYIDKNVIASNLLYVIPNASIFDFGIITSTMHMSWVRTVGGRLKSDYRYIGSIVYNNFPWPKSPTEKQIKSVEKMAERILEVRDKYPDSTLADLYDPLTMPSELVKAHNKLDQAVDKCYRSQPFTTEMKRVEFLFELYKKYIENEKQSKAKAKRHN